MHLQAAMLHGCYKALLDNRIHFARDCVTVSKSAYQFSAKPADFVSSKKLLAKQLKAFRDLPNGKITGKMTDGQSDDIGMAFLMALYVSANGSGIPSAPNPIPCAPTGIGRTVLGHSMSRSEWSWLAPAVPTFPPKCRPPTKRTAAVRAFSKDLYK